MKSAARKSVRPSLSSRIGNVVDHVVMAFSPQRGAKRIATRRMWEAAEQRHDRIASASGGHHFEGAERDRLNGHKWLGSRLSIDSALEMDHEELRTRSRELYRNDSVGGAIDSRTTHIVGTGFKTRCLVDELEGVITAKDAKAFRKAADRLWKNFSKKSDRSRLRSLWQTSQLVVREWMSSGEALAVMSDVGHADSHIPLVIEVIDVDRLETPPKESGNPLIRLGIEKDAQGRVVAYHIRKTHPHDTKKVDLSYDRVPVDRVIHLFTMYFAEQTRGLPWMFRVIKRARDAKDCDDATVAAMQIEACFAMFIENDASSAGPSLAALGNASGTNSQGHRIEDIHPGMVDYLGPGQKPHFANPSKPGGTYGTMQEWNYRRIAAGVNWSYEMMVKNWTGLSFAGGRLALIDANLDAESAQQLVAEMFLSRVWERAIDEGVIVGYLPIKPKVYRENREHFLQHEVTPPTWRYELNPGEQVKAAWERIDKNLSTMDEEAAAMGWTLEELLDGKKRYVDLLDERGLAMPTGSGNPPPATAPAGKKGKPKEPTNQDEEIDDEEEETEEEESLVGSGVDA